MTEKDDWGRDPQVRYLRKVFSLMERGQKEFLLRIGLSPLDERLRRGREGALHIFERAWMTATRRGLALAEEDFGPLYQACLARVLRSRGLDIPKDALRESDKITALLPEDTP
jgi:hypothetical protein